MWVIYSCLFNWELQVTFPVQAWLSVAEGPLLAQSLSHNKDVTRMKQYGVLVFNHFPLPSTTQWRNLGAAASFSTPVDPNNTATEGLDLAVRRQLRPEQRGNRGEGTGKQLEVKATTGGRRWMNSTPQDQSGTSSYSRSSFSSSMQHLIPAPQKPHHPTAYIGSFYCVYIERGRPKEEQGRKHEREHELERKVERKVGGG